VLREETVRRASRRELKEVGEAIDASKGREQSIKAPERKILDAWCQRSADDGRDREE